MNQSKMSSLTLKAIIALAGLSCLCSCSSSDSQESQWLKSRQTICQALKAGQVGLAESTLEEATKSGKSSANKICLSRLGKLYRYSGSSEKALVPLKKVLDADESIADKGCPELPYDLIALADCFIDKKQYEPAADLLLRAAVMEQTMSSNAQLIPCLRKIARVFEALNKKEKAQVFYQLAIEADGREQGIAENNRAAILIFDEANLMWDYSSFLARQNQKEQSDALEARADHLFKLLIERTGKLSEKVKEKKVIVFQSDTDAAKAALLINVLIDEGKFAEAEQLLDRFYDISIDLAGFANPGEDNHGPFIKTLADIWCAENTAPKEKIEGKEVATKASQDKKMRTLGYASDVDYQAGRFDDAQLKASIVLLNNYNSPEAMRVLSLIAATNNRAQETRELGMRLKTFARQ